jgi:2-polyprenyl-3-methyl-5-hydroxy-6-metoxy-1,4-benzoquinol methylase
VHVIKQVVRDYSIVAKLTPTEKFAVGDSASPKALIFHIQASNELPTDVLDIGFGAGTLGQMIKANPATSHWSVDGIDGWWPNCQNQALLDQRIYRNIWHGLAQDLPSEQLQRYRLICLLDVIEHLEAETARRLLRDLLSSMADDASLFISTPLWFYPQHAHQDGDLEEHLIGIPATSMMVLMPYLYAVNHPLIGGFVLGKRSLEFIDFFHPTADRGFSFDKGMKIANAIGMQCQAGVVYKMP